MSLPSPLSAKLVYSWNEATVLDDAMKADLIADAKAAWQFFERASRAMPGMATTNIWQEGNSYGSYDIATMWDTGSIVLATIAAHSLGFISTKDFDRRVAGIETFLRRATFSHRGHRLPAFRTRIDNTGIVDHGYDTTDTGRLFVALHTLKTYSGGRHDIFPRLKWSIAGTLSNGRMQDIKGGHVSPAQSNIYRYYVSRGYGLIGVAHAPVYDGASPEDSPEARAAFLKELAAIGPISTEPNLLDEIELGGSPFTRVIADELGVAQERRFNETGRLTCVSEVPIDAEPWFTYQGYDLNRTGEWAWTVYPSVTDARWATAEFAETYRMVSTKAAFLWFAARPNEYTRQLWTHVRTKARAAAYGFHPGVYEASGRPPRNIDVNTNAIVLQSVAYALAARSPLARLAMKT